MTNIGIIVSGSRSFDKHPKRSDFEQGVLGALSRWITAIESQPSVFGEDQRIFIITGDADPVDRWGREFAKRDARVRGLLVYALDGYCHIWLRNGDAKKIPWCSRKMVVRNPQFPPIRNRVMVVRSLTMDVVKLAAFKDPKSKTGGTDQTIRCAKDVGVATELFLANEDGGFDLKE